MHALSLCNQYTNREAVCWSLASCFRVCRLRVVKLNVSGVSAPPQFNSIHWDNGVTWERQSPFPTRSVHLVYMTHLDLGFTDTTRDVCDK